MAAVVLEQLTKVYPNRVGADVTALSNVHLEVQDHELMVLVGPSGSGKTTLLRLIAGLDKPDGGAIFFDGQPVHKLRPGDRNVAMVSQGGALFPKLRVAENIALGLKLRKVPRTQIKSRVEATAGLLGLLPCLDRLPGTLSGGERQRVALGRAIIREPAVFLLDEPLSHLDAVSRYLLRGELAALQRRLRVTMVCVTHDQEEALALGDRIAVLHGGRIHQVACPRVVYDKPTDQFVAGFIGQPPMNFVRGTIQERDASLWFVECAPPTFDQHNSLLCLPLTSQQAAFLAAWKSRELIMGLRSEHIRLAGEDSLPRTSFRAGVALHKVTGPDALLHLQFTHHQLIARIPATTPDQTGTTAAFTVDMDHARFFDSASTNALA